MATGKNFLDRLIERLDRLDTSSVQNYVLKLVRDRGFLETVFNSIQEGVVVIDHDIRIHYLNLAARHLLGIRDRFEGQRLDRYLKGIDWVALMAANPDEWHRITMQEIEVFYPQNRILTFYLVPHTDSNDDDQISLATIIFHDVTEARRRTEKAIESEKVEAVTKLAAGVAHEIGNPLNSLAIHLKLLARQLSGPMTDEMAGEALESVDIALREVSRLDSIVNNFLRAIRPAAADLRPLQIQRVIAEALSFMRHEIEDRNIRVEASLPENLPTILGDADQLKQAFYNILKNSLQAMDAKGLLSIACSAPGGDWLEIRFADTGKGIAAVDLAHIMEPYYTTRGDGSGLGLLVVERVLRSHGAEFGIDSSVGEGTVFTIRFPLRERQIRLLQAPGVSDHDSAGHFSE